MCSRFLLVIPVMQLSMGTVHAADTIEGRWITEDKKAEVTIRQCGAIVCGRVTQILVPTPKGPPVDEYNPDPKLRDRPILGLSILNEFRDRGTNWVGTIYSPEEGATYRSLLRRNPDGTLNVRGCIFFLCRSQTWQPSR